MLNGHKEKIKNWTETKCKNAGTYIFSFFPTTTGVWTWQVSSLKNKSASNFMSQEKKTGRGFHVLLY